MKYSEMKDTAIIAEEAAQLLDNQLLKEAFVSIEENIIDQMKTAPIIGGDKANEFRDKLILTLQMVQSVQDQLIGYVTSGYLANNKPEEI